MTSKSSKSSEPGASRPKLLCTIPWVPDDVRGILEPVMDVTYAAPDRALLEATIAEYDGWWVHFQTRCDRALLERADRLKVVCTATTGTDHIDKVAAAERGVTILHNAADLDLLNTFTATAELGWFLLIGLMRHARGAMAAAHAGDWTNGAARFEGRQLRGRTLGVLGMGRLGTMTSRWAQAFDMRVLGCDLKPIDLPGVTRVSFDELLAESDAIAIHIHLTPENVGLFNASVFDRMKPGAVLVNTSRGDVVDEAALIDALASGRLAGYGADVVHDEFRSDMNDSALVQYARDHDNVMLTPHIGGSTIDSVTAARIHSANKLKAFFAPSS